MAKKIGVIIDFLNDKYERQLNAAAAKYGYEIEYFPSSAEAVGRVDDCEILYGHCSQKVIRSAKRLKWYCCCWAGVDHFCDESLYQNPDCRLTNSSGAYGTTISEHLIMVCLMLLRRQMEYTEIIRAGGWETLPGGIRSLHGARITVRREIRGCDFVEDFFAYLGGVDVFVVCVAYRLHARADPYSALRDELYYKPSGEHERSGEPAGKMSAAVKIRTLSVFHKGGVIGM